MAASRQLALFADDDRIVRPELPRVTKTPVCCGTLAGLAWHDRRFFCLGACRATAVAYYVAGGDEDE